MAHKKAGGAVGKNRDSISKRLGVKAYGGQNVEVGNIIIRQKGTKFHSGTGTRLGNDFTIYATAPGTVAFKQRLGKTVVTVIAE